MDAKIICYICEDSIVGEFKILPCLHTYCSLCFNDVINDCLDKGTEYKCNICNELFKIGIKSNNSLFTVKPDEIINTSTDILYDNYDYANNICPTHNKYYTMYAIESEIFYCDDCKNANEDCNLVNFKDFNEYYDELTKKIDSIDQYINNIDQKSINLKISHDTIKTKINEDFEIIRNDNLDKLDMVNIRNSFLLNDVSNKFCDLILTLSLIREDVVEFIDKMKILKLLIKIKCIDNEQLFNKNIIIRCINKFNKFRTNIPDIKCQNNDVNSLPRVIYNLNLSETFNQNIGMVDYKLADDTSDVFYPITNNLIMSTDANKYFKLCSDRIFYDTVNKCDYVLVIQNDNVIDTNVHVYKMTIDRFLNINKYINFRFNENVNVNKSCSYLGIVPKNSILYPNDQKIIIACDYNSVCNGFAFIYYYPVIGKYTVFVKIIKDNHIDFEKGYLIDEKSRVFVTNSGNCLLNSIKDKSIIYIDCQRNITKWSYSTESKNSENKLEKITMVNDNMVLYYKNSIKQYLTFRVRSVETFEHVYITSVYLH
jgi:hypothetical protein